MSGLMRNLAASTAFALALAAPAQAGLIDDNTALIKYDVALVAAIKVATKAQPGTTEETAASLRTKGFMTELVSVLRDPSDKVRIVDYPKPATVENLRITAVVPPQAMANHDIPVCAEKASGVVGIWNITSKGEVLPVVWNGSRVPDQPNGAACKAFILAARASIAQKYADMKQPEGTPMAAAAVAAVGVGGGAPRTAPLPGVN